jgi:hypothetical protein
MSVSMKPCRSEKSVKSSMPNVEEGSEGSGKCCPWLPEAKRSACAFARDALSYTVVALITSLTRHHV